MRWLFRNNTIRLPVAGNGNTMWIRVLGLRNLAQLQPVPDDVEQPAWHVQRWLDTDGSTWQEIDLGKLARDPAFLQVGA